MPAAPNTAPHTPLQAWLDTPLQALPQRMAEGHLAQATPAHWFALSCRLLALPSTARLNSFTLHAPLELLARIRLMGQLGPANRPLACVQMLATALMSAQARGCQVSESTGPPGDDVPEGTAHDWAQALGLALDAGNTDRTWALANALAQASANCSTAALCRLLARVVRDRMGAAAHLPIFLNLLARLHELDADAALLARPLLPALLRELAQQPEARVDWPEAAQGRHGMAALPRGGATPDDALSAHLLALRPLAQAETSGIWPLLRQAVQAGRHLPLPDLIQAHPQQALATACRVAALSMLQEPLDKARYGWSHALTLPQAWWGLCAPALPEAEQQAMARLAALHVVAMRSGIAQVVLQAPPATDASTAPCAAEIQGRFDACAAQACIRADAHAVKYVLACQDAAQASPPDAPLYIAAAEKLCADWVQACPEDLILTTLDQR